MQDIFNQVRADKILLPIGNSNTPSSNRQSVISLGSDTRGSTMRSPSGRSNNDRLNALKRGSIRGLQGTMNSPYGSGSGVSSDGRLSPTPSYATSNTDSGLTAGIGFASNLSHTVIREHEDEKDSVGSRTSLGTTDDELNEDELALLGAPWAKEGMLWRRAGGEAAMKKVSKKDWKQYFGVVQRGEMLLFTFGEGSGSGSFGAVGGGNWTVSFALGLRPHADSRTMPMLLGDIPSCILTSRLSKAATEKTDLMSFQSRCLLAKPSTSLQVPTSLSLNGSRLANTGPRGNLVNRYKEVSLTWSMAGTGSSTRTTKNPLLRPKTIAQVSNLAVATCPASTRLRMVGSHSVLRRATDSGSTTGNHLSRLLCRASLTKKRK